VGQTDGDAGGNLVEIFQGDATKNLHAFWDDLLGPNTVTAKTVIKTKKYQKAAKALAKKQMALAGERLANLLNAELK
jgi:hypothetical protein